MSEQKRRMLAGELYIDSDPELAEDRARAERIFREFNGVPKLEFETKRRLLDELFGTFGEDAEVVAPLYCDYGSNIHIGARTFLNFGVTLLDVAEIRIGEDVMVGPHTQIATPFHATDPQLRREHWEGAYPITVEDNVWIGGGVIVCPGVTIGTNSIIGAGSVVTKDIPADVIAAGSPARVLRSLGSSETTS